MLFPVVFAPTHAFRMMKFLARKLPLSPVSDVDFQEILSSPMTIPVIHPTPVASLREATGNLVY